jgi:hypothetical protein
MRSYHFSIFIPQRHNGYIYAVAHVHNVDSRDIIQDGDTPVDIEAGFEIAPGDASDIQAANAHTWGSRLIVFYDGSIAATALNIAVNRFRIGMSLIHPKACLEILHKTGWRHGRDNLVRDGAKVWAKDKDNDIFLRKRA